MSKGLKILSTTFGSRQHSNSHSANNIQNNKDKTRTFEIASNAANRPMMISGIRMADKSYIRAIDCTNAASVSREVIASPEETGSFSMIRPSNAVIKSESCRTIYYYYYRCTFFLGDKFNVRVVDS